MYKIYTMYIANVVQCFAQLHSRLRSLGDHKWENLILARK